MRRHTIFTRTPFPSLSTHPTGGAVLLRNVAAFCAASVVGDWWWKGASERAPTVGALRRAFTTSFGTLSLGALLVSFARALKAATKARADRNRGGSGAAAVALAVIACVAQCLVAILAALIEWANHWAVVFAALTGLAFKPAGLAAIDLFRRRGWDALINDDLIGTALNFASVACAALGALAGGALALALDTTPAKATHAGIAAALSFAVALVMASVLSSFIETAARAVFVSWALSPGSLAATHPEHFGRLAGAWQEAHPALLESSGYAAHIAAVEMGGGAPKGGYQTPTGPAVVGVRR